MYEEVLKDNICALNYFLADMAMLKLIVKNPSSHYMDEKNYDLTNRLKKYIL